MRVFLTFLLVIFLFSCDRESISEKEVNSKYQSIQRKWEIVAIQTVGPGADSVQIELNSATIDWNTKCKYSDEDGNYNYCSGKGDFNGLDVTYSYGYDATDEKYILRFSSLQTNESSLERKLSAIINGRWDFDVSGNTFIAKQVHNDRLPGVLTTLTARAR